MRWCPPLPWTLTLAILLLAPAARADKVALVLVNAAGLSTEAQVAARKAMAAEVTRSGHAPDDLSALAAGIFEAGMLVPEFDRAPPRGWPEPLRPVWEEGMAACRGQIGRPGGNPKRRLALAAAAVECQRILSEALYLRLLAHAAPDQVLEVTVRPARGGQDAPMRLSGRLFTPGGRQAREAQAEAPAKGLAGGVAHLSALLLGGGGQATVAPGNPALPVKPTPTLAALEAEPAQPKLPDLQLAVPCIQKLPAKLELTPAPAESRFAASLVHRWEKSLARGAGAAPLSCSLRGYPTRVNAPGGATVDAVEVILSCGADEYRAGATVDPPLRRRRGTLHDELTAALIRQLASDRCD
jgi:hypothetical protein